jgi:threonine/homoserine/homoserine lactone efflux protein
MAAWLPWLVLVWLLSVGAVVLDASRRRTPRALWLPILLAAVLPAFGWAIYFFLLRPRARRLARAGRRRSTGTPPSLMRAKTRHRGGA